MEWVKIMLIAVSIILTVLVYRHSAYVAETTEKIKKLSAEIDDCRSEINQLRIRQRFNIGL